MISLIVALNAVISLLSIEKIRDFSSFFKDMVDLFDFRTLNSGKKEL